MSLLGNLILGLSGVPVANLPRGSTSAYGEVLNSGLKFAGEAGASSGASIAGKDVNAAKVLADIAVDGSPWTRADTASAMDNLMSFYRNSGNPKSGPSFYELTADRHPGSSAKSLDYLNADLAKYYGMNASTAYQEALSNTAYQRAVKDMQSAGLNPAALFGAGRASTADGVSYVSQASSGSGGYSGRRRGSGTSAKGRFVDSGLYSAIVNGAGLIGSVITKGKPSGFFAGQAAAKTVLGLFDSLR